MYSGKPPPSFLIPARNSRHRTACLALYRALLELAPKVSLPEDLVPPAGRPNPIARQIARAFRRNREDVSPRIVYPALRAGYDALAALTAAAEDPSGAEHASVVALLRSRAAESARSAAHRGSPPTDPKTGERPPKRGAPRPGTVPLLVNVTPAPTPYDPDPKPVYATPSRPVPASALGGTGRRQVPRLDMASDFSMLRLSKPQPALLSRVLTQKVIKRAERGRALQEITEEGYAEAEEEDEWEMALAQLLSDERWAALERACDSDNPEKRPGGDEQGEEEPPQVPRLRREELAIRLDEAARATYCQHLRVHGAWHLQAVLTREREDQIARADAMRRLIARESALAQQEKDERRRRSHEERHARWLAARLAGAGGEAGGEGEGEGEGNGEVLSLSEGEKEKEKDNQRLPGQDEDEDKDWRKGGASF
ncbi:hypothetical protein F4809DRAFT_57540 [Biscogniauxia mediterranea]|nr:hypothetical protein F4809DRAFT_57540 [Biscogniauxia mediterranea]